MPSVRSRQRATSPIAAAALSAALFVLVLYWSGSSPLPIRRGAKRRRLDRFDAFAPPPASVCKIVDARLFRPALAILSHPFRLELSRRGLEDDARDEPVQLASEGKLDAMESRKNSARVLLGIGAGLAVLSGVSLFIDLAGSTAESTEIGLACTGGDCQLVARDTW